MRSRRFKAKPGKLRCFYLWHQNYIILSNGATNQSRSMALNQTWLAYSFRAFFVLSFTFLQSPTQLYDDAFFILACARPLPSRLTMTSPGWQSCHLEYSIDHFQVTLNLCFKTNLCAKPFIYREMRSDLNENLHEGGIHFHMNGLAWKAGIDTVAKDTELWYSLFEPGEQSRHLDY